jgi:hypothetical protein
MPHKVLEQLVCILLLHHHPRRLNDIPRILDQFLAIRWELVDIDRGILDIGSRRSACYSSWACDLASELVSTAVNEFGEWAYLSVVIGVVVCFDDRICDGAQMEPRKIRHFQGFKRGNLALFLTDVFALNSGPIGQTLAGLP